MSPARIWGGEVALTRTGGTLPRTRYEPASGRLQSLFVDDNRWYEHRNDSLDAPSYIARGAVVGMPTSSGDTVLFASEPRP